MAQNIIELINNPHRIHHFDSNLFNHKMEIDETPDDLIFSDEYTSHLGSRANGIPFLLNHMDQISRDKLIKKYQIPNELLTDDSAKTSILLIRELEKYAGLYPSFKLGVDTANFMLSNPLFKANQMWITDVRSMYEWLIAILTPNVVEQNFEYSVHKVTHNEVVIRAKSREPLKETSKEKHVFAETIAWQNAGSLYTFARYLGKNAEVFIDRSQNRTGDNFTDTRLVIY